MSDLDIIRSIIGSAPATSPSAQTPTCTDEVQALLIARVHALEDSVDVHKHDRILSWVSDAVGLGMTDEDVINAGTWWLEEHTPEGERRDCRNEVARMVISRTAMRNSGELKLTAWASDLADTDDFSIFDPLCVPTPPSANKPKGLPIISAADLVAAHPTYNPLVIDGLLREGETMNVIASPKVGKSWLVLLMAFCIANGAAFLGRRCAKGNVLLIDNELHPETLAQRLRAMANALGQPLGGIHVVSLRGILRDLPSLRKRIEVAAQSIKAKVIVLDALYRLLPGGTSENDNAGMMHLYNCIDGIAKTTGAAVVCIHHASKGGQGEKSITDGGSGAGAISRAADTHVFLREHEDPGMVVMDAVARSWPPPVSSVLQSVDHVWQVVKGADAARVKGRKNKIGGDIITLDNLPNHLPQYPEPIKTIMARLKGEGLNPSMSLLEGVLGLAAKNKTAVCEVGRWGARMYGKEATPDGGGTIIEKVIAHIRSNPEDTHAEVASACGCSTKTVQRAVEMDEV